MLPLKMQAPRQRSTKTVGLHLGTTANLTCASPLLEGSIQYHRQGGGETWRPLGGSLSPKSQALFRRSDGASRMLQASPRGQLSSSMNTFPNGWFADKDMLNTCFPVPLSKLSHPGDGRSRISDHSRRGQSSTTATLATPASIRSDTWRS